MFPPEYGGLGLTIDHQQAFFEEAAGYLTPSYFGVSIGMLGATILDCGTEEQKRRISRRSCAPTRSSCSSCRSRREGPTWPAH